MKRAFFALPLLCLLLNAETVDRLVVIVGSVVLTELQIDEDLRVAALLNGQPVNRDVDSRRAAADRLVQQLLVNHEIVLSRYQSPSDRDVDTLFNSVQEGLGGADALKKLFTKYAVSEETLRDHLKAQLATIRFIDVRFTPDITISDSEIETAYGRLVAALHSTNPDITPPPLDAKEKIKLSNSLLGDRTDAALDSWLAESRKQINIVYIDPALQ